MTQEPEAFEFKIHSGPSTLRMTAAELEEFIVASRPVWGPIVERHMEQYVRQAIRAALADRLGRVTQED